MPHRLSDQNNPSLLAGKDKFGAPPGRPYGLQSEAKRIIRSVSVSQIGGGKMANEIVGGIKSAVAKAMDDAKKEIVGATTELTAEIRDGAQAVKRAIQAEVVNVRREFAEIVGNATAEAEDAVDQVKKDVQTQTGALTKDVAA